MTKVIVYDNFSIKKGVVIIAQIEFYQKANGKIPVSDFLQSLPPKLKAKAIKDIDLLEEQGNALREPHVKPIKGEKNKGLYELRIKFSSDIARIFYFTYYNNKFILLHGFIKKTLITPPREIEKARSYMEDYKRRNQE